MSIRKIDLTVGNEVFKFGYTKSYPYDDKTVYKIPTYLLTVSGRDDQGKQQTRTFEVYRFGVKRKHRGTRAEIVGLYKPELGRHGQSHTIRGWIANYSPHSQRGEKGAWDVIGKKVLIHDGPDNPRSTINLFGTIGCVEICGKRGFEDFNNFIITLSGSKKPTRDAKLTEIGSSMKMKIDFLEVLEANKPALEIVSKPQEVDAETPR